MTVTGALASLVVVAGVVVAPAAVAAPDNTPRAADVVDHWTPHRLAAAEPRDLLIDERGLGYRSDDDGRLTPHGHGRPAVVAAPTVVPTPQRGTPQPTPQAAAPKDTTAPTIGVMTPAAGATIGTAATFSATVTDASGLRSVTFTLTAPNGRNSSFAATAGANGLYSVSLEGFTVGPWSWTVKATDTKGNARTSNRVTFTVATTPSDPTLITNQEWTGGAVQSAAGRIFFEMPDSTTPSGWAGYVCSGTVVQDDAENESVILTAAHCVYDDVAKVFARNVLFIPDQAATTGVKTDVDCTNDRYGCWAPSYGVVDTDWTTRTFPDNVAWDYAYYVVPTTDAHSGATASSDSLELAVGTLPVQFTAPEAGVANSTADRTHALGYSYSRDPDFMYCAEDMTTNGTVNWFLPNCGLSGGASGGPWIQPLNTTTGTGPIISVNSWGYTTKPGMAGPKLAGTSASTLFGAINAGTTVPVDGGDVLD